MRIAEPVVALRPAPDPSLGIDTQALFGERAFVNDEQEGWAWVQLERDDYVGWLPAAALAAPGRAPTHRVETLRTFLYPAANMKRPPRLALVCGSLLHVTAVEGDFALTPEGAVWAGHLAPANATTPDFVAVAERFIGVPYLWGGRESLGLDCSGLVQQALLACGRACPRDTDQQALMGRPAETLARGDLVFWRGHVAILLDDRRILHANAHHMAVAIEPLAEAVARIGATGTGQPTAYRRLV